MAQEVYTPGGGDFAENPDQRCPVVLLIDTSGSMMGEPIRELNAGLVQFREELAADEVARNRVELAIITFGPVKVDAPFATVDTFSPQTLSASGDTPMGEAIERALDLLDERKALYRVNGIPYNRPWIFMITDGGPTDSWTTAASRVRQGEEHRQFLFYAVGVQGANFETLKQISIREPLKLQGLQFRKLFQWLSSSLKNVSRSRPTDAVQLTNPAAPGGWATTA